MLTTVRRLAVPLLLAVPLVLAGCGSDPASGRDLADAPLAPLPSSAGIPDPSPTGSGPVGGATLIGDHALLITIDAGDGGGPERFTVGCVVGGDAFTSRSTLPDAERACAHLQSLDDPFAEVPGDAICTQEFGGPQTAVIAGSWGGDGIRLELSRTDGCRIAQWDSLAPLLPVDVG